MSIKTNKLIYLASPYTHKSKRVMLARLVEISKIGAILTTKGHILFCPISQSATLARYGDLKTDWNFWKRFDLTVLSRCDELFVVTMDGWKESVGVQAEIAFAEAQGIPITYLKPEDYYETKEKKDIKQSR